MVKVNGKWMDMVWNCVKFMESSQFWLFRLFLNHRYITCFFHITNCEDWWSAAIWVWLMIIVVSLVVINIVPWLAEYPRNVT